LRGFARCRAGFLVAIGERGAIGVASRGHHSILNRDAIRPLSVEVGKRSVRCVPDDR
jgi:hypothetical protein